MTYPRRITLSRARGWRKPPNTITVARPSRHGNPFAVGQEASVSVTGTDHLGYEVRIPITRQLAVDLYAADLEVTLAATPEHPDDIAAHHEWLEHLNALRGHNLACWCKPGDPCHADYLIALVNSPAFARIITEWNTAHPEQRVAPPVVPVATLETR